MSEFTNLVEAELKRARTKHVGMLGNAHEAFAVIWEELDEFWDEVRAKKHDPRAMLKELVQVAAMCARTAEDLGFIERAEAAGIPIERRRLKGVVE